MDVEEVSDDFDEDVLVSTSRKRKTHKVAPPSKRKRRDVDDGGFDDDAEAVGENESISEGDEEEIVGAHRRPSARIRSADKLISNGKTESEDGNSAFCALCGRLGDIICCDFCPLSFHPACILQNPHFRPYLPLDSAMALVQLQEDEMTLQHNRRVRRARKQRQREKQDDSADEEGMSNHLPNLSTSASTPLGSPLGEEVLGQFSTALGEASSLPAGTASAPPVSSSLGSSSTDLWRCPKCAGVVLADVRPHHRAYHLRVFQFERWKEKTSVPSVMIPSQEGGGERVDLSVKYKKSAKTLCMSDLQGYDFQYCLLLLSQEAVLRGIDFLFSLCHSFYSSKSDADQEVFLDYGAQVAWLLSNLLEFCDASTAAVHAECSENIQKILVRWHSDFERRGRDFCSDEKLVFNLIEAVEADCALDPSSERCLMATKELHHAASRQDINKYINFEVSKKLYSNKVCPNCNEIPVKSRSICEGCGFRYRLENKTIEYGRLLESLVWASLFSRQKVTLDYTVSDVLQEVRRCRPWRHRHELGVEDFRLQCYLLTHVIFILTRWGKYRLSPSQFSEDYNFLRQVLREAVALDDHELVGEILQSLRLFGTPDSRMCSESLAFATAYLLDKEARRGSKGRYATQKAAFYDQMHSSYCALLGLSLPRRLAEIPEADTEHRSWWDLFSRKADGVEEPFKLPPKTCDVPEPSDLKGEIVRKETVWSNVLKTNQNGKKENQYFERQKFTCRVCRYGTEMCIPMADVLPLIGNQRGVISHLIPRITGGCPLYVRLDTADHSSSVWIEKRRKHPLPFLTRKHLENLVELVEFKLSDDFRHADSAGLKHLARSGFSPKGTPPDVPPSLATLLQFSPWIESLASENKTAEEKRPRGRPRQIAKKGAPLPSIPGNEERKERVEATEEEKLEKDEDPLVVIENAKNKCIQKLEEIEEYVAWYKSNYYPDTQNSALT